MILVNFVFLFSCFITLNYYVNGFLDHGYGYVQDWPYVKKYFPYAIQSPIDILKNDTKAIELPKLKIYMNWNLSKKTVNITNTGYTMRVTMIEDEADDAPLIMDGPLSSVYKFHELHVHWSEDDACGSEHWINGKCFSAEAHVVFFNTKYNSIKDALEKQDGLAVIGILGLISKVDNPRMEYLVSKLPRIREPNSWILGTFFEEFNWLARSMSGRYVSYSGSLTTPPYTQYVYWIITLKPFSISHRQLNMFRQLLSDKGGSIGCNDRPPQQYNGQPIVLPYDPSPIVIILTFEED